MAILYTAHNKAIGGRDGSVETDNKAISLKITKPGSDAGTNPEQLFGCAYAACFGGAVGAVAKNHNKEVGNVEVQTDINLNKDDKGFFLSAGLNVILPGIEKALGTKIVKEAHAMCPYSKAIKGNVEVTLKLNGQEI